MKYALAAILALVSPLAFAAGNFGATDILLGIALICFFLTAIPMADPWKAHQPNLLALGLFFWALSQFVGR